MTFAPRWLTVKPNSRAASVANSLNSNWLVLSPQCDLQGFDYQILEGLLPVGSSLHALEGLRFRSVFCLGVLVFDDYNPSSHGH